MQNNRILQAPACSFIHSARTHLGFRQRQALGRAARLPHEVRADRGEPVVGEVEDAPVGGVGVGRRHALQRVRTKRGVCAGAQQRHVRVAPEVEVVPSLYRYACSRAL